MLKTISDIISDIFNLKQLPPSKHIINSKTKFYRDLSSYSDEQLAEFIEDELLPTRDRADNQPGKTDPTQLELASLHYTAITERNNRKRNRLAFVGIVVAAVIATLHLIVLIFLK